MQELEDNFKKNGGIFKEFKMNEIFRKLSAPYKGNSRKQDNVSTIQTDEFNLPLINCKYNNNGIMYYGRKEDYTYYENVLSVIYNGPPTEGQTYYQEEIGVYTDAYLIGLKDTTVKINREIGLYLTSVINASIHNEKFRKYSRGHKATWDNKVENDVILVPVLGNKLAFDYMQNYVEILEQDYISELDAYLKVVGLDNYDLTEEEKESLTKDYTFQTKRLENLFTMHASKKKFNANSIKLDGGCPYVVRTAENNGIKGYTNQNPDYLNLGNTISLGQDTATMFYQEKPYFTGDKIKIVEPLDFVLTDKIALYLISCFNKTLSTFKWGQTSFNEEKLKKILVNVPMIDSQIDIKYMETYIRAIEKLVIKDLVDWKNKEIKTTKEVVKNV